MKCISGSVEADVSKLNQFLILEHKYKVTLGEQVHSYLYLPQKGDAPKTQKSHHTSYLLWLESR